MWLNPQQVNCELGINGQFCFRVTFKRISEKEIKFFLRRLLIPITE